uniref:Uncharacterized protein n=1 Tax=Anguilla anguilla TaxID=7936 RepID=A0A0E9R8M9_ANGAN
MAILYYSAKSTVQGESTAAHLFKKQKSSQFLTL